MADDNFELRSGDVDQFQSASQGDDGPMDEERYKGGVRAAIEDAIDYIDGYVAHDRAKAIKYYRGDPLGNEEEGRSKIVMTEVRDVVQAIMPSLLRIFTSNDKICEFAPRSAATVPLAEQQTDYVNFVFYRDNPGFTILHSVFKDALTVKTGIVKWYWSKDTTIKETALTALTQPEISLLTEDKHTEIIELEQKGEIPGGSDPETGQALPPTPLYDVRIRRKLPKNRAIVEAVPPEEFLIARDARDLDTSRYVGHRSHKTISDLVAMGYDQETVEANAGAPDTFALNYEAQTRNPAITTFMQATEAADETQKDVLYVESYLRIDKDGDGIAELRRVCTIGTGHYILYDEIADEVPFAVFCPDPEPHTFIGFSLADQTRDLQEIKSALVRNTLDSLAASINPRTAVVENQVNLDDVLNNEVGGIICMRVAGAVQPLAMPFVGQQAMPFIQWFDQLRAMRTGVDPARTQGLDPDALQSTTQSAVAATISGSQERIELIARIFAETGMARLFRGLNKLICENMDEPRIVRMRGTFVNVDPRTWDGDLDVNVDVALGRGTDQEKLQFLMIVAQKQEQIVQMLGPDNPLCGLKELRATYGQILNLAGFKDDSKYFGVINDQVIAQLKAQAAQRPPDPNQQLVQIEAQKVQADAQNKNAKTQIDAQAKSKELQLRQFEIVSREQTAREQIRVNAMTEMARLEAQYNTQIDVARLQALVNHSANVTDASIKAATNAHDIETSAATDRHAAEVDAATKRHKALVDASVKRDANALAAASSETE